MARTNQPQPRRRRNGERGQALVEFALVSIVFFLMIFGIIDFARLFQSWVTVQHASREGARYAVTGQTTCTGFATRDACITYRAKKATAGLTGGGSSGADVSVSFKSWEYPAYGGTGTAGDSGDQCDAIEVTVAYAHDFILPVFQLLAPSGVSIEGRQRMVNEPFGQCT